MHCHWREFWKLSLCCTGAVSLALLGGCAQSRGYYEGGSKAQNYADDQEAFPPLMDGGPRPVIALVQPARVDFSNAEPPGTILIDTARRKLYFTLNANEAYDYPISVGREGFTWTGTEKISRIADWPDWYPPKEMLERDPKLPTKMLGGLRNPLGAKALFLGNTLYRIHGTNDAKTIGFAASSGCFRMLNEHVVHLASLATVGTTVKVLPSVAAIGAREELPWLPDTVALTRKPASEN